VLDALDEAVTAGLLMRGGGLTYAFTHALVQETVHDELGTSRRVALHAATAAELERSGAADVEQGSSELAYHWLEAAPAGHAAHAAHAAERAARSASQQLAYEESARLYEAAAAVVPPDRSRASRPAWLLIESARMRFVAGELDRAASLCERAAEMARNTEDAELLAAAALVIEGVGDASLSAMIGRLCEEALAAAPAVPEVTRSRLLSQLVTARMYLGDYASLEPLSREALDAAERIGDADALVAALRARHIAFSGPDGLDERVRIADRMLLLAQALDRRVDEVWARLWRFDAAVALGRLDDAGAEVDAVARLAQPMRNPLLLWHLSRCRFALAHACGDFDAAVRAAEDGDRFARSAGQLAGERRHMQRVILAVSTGEDCEDDITAIRLAREGDRGQRTSAPMLLHELTVALLALARGDAERAAALLDSMPPPESWRIMPPARLVTLRHHATLLAALGRREACASMQQQLLPYADQFATSGAGTVASFGSVELTLGSLAAALDRADRAVQHLERALERNAGTGMRPAAEEARFELAKTLFQRDRGTDRGRALQLAAECEKRAGALGMRLLAARAAELRAQLRAGTRRERLLTPREVEVARLVAEGLTSREIAEAMHISARTADNHVQHILDKLGLRSRSQVAAWVARRA
jgi:DNA-binding CsgD family transcriptional regulator